MAAEFLVDLLQANLAAALVIVLVMAVRGPARRLFGPDLAYGLWLLPPAAMAAAFLPAAQGPAIPAPPVQAWAAVETALSQSASLPAGSTGPEAWPLGALLLAAWIAGAAVMLLQTAGSQHRALRAFGAITPDREGVLRADRPGCGPAIVGLLKPSLVLPADFETRFDERERALILTHERTHLAFGHVWLNTAVALIRALNWFNPLVHVGAYYARVDQELACDAAVVERHPGERRTYAQAMLKSQLVRAPLPLGCTWPARTTPMLKERIEMLAIERPNRARRLIGAAAIALSVAAAGYGAWAAQPGATALIGDCTGVRMEVVSLSAGLPANVRIAPLNAERLAAAMQKTHLRDVVDAGGTAADVAAVLRRKWAEGPRALTVPAPGTERFAVFQDGEFGIAGAGPRGQTIIVNDGSFDEVEHPAGIAVARTQSIVRPDPERSGAEAACPSVPALAMPIERPQAAAIAAPRGKLLSSGSAPEQPRPVRIERLQREELPAAN